MYMSAASLCHVGVAAAFAANLSLASRPVAHASFDCGKAQTPLEQAICSDSRLGKADIVLSRVYASVLKFDSKEDRDALIRNERQWLRSIPATCGLTTNPPSAKALNCVRIAFELRFTALDNCEQGGEKVTDCLKMQEGDSGFLEDRRMTDADMAEVYRKAETIMGATQHEQLAKSESDWQSFVNTNCALGAEGDVPNLLARACTDDASDVRAGQLMQCIEKSPLERIHCLNDFQLFEKWPIAP